MFNDKDIKDLKNRVLTLEEKMKIVDSFKLDEIKNQETKIKTYLLTLMDNKEFIYSSEWKNTSSWYKRTVFDYRFEAEFIDNDINIYLEQSYSSQSIEYRFGFCKHHIGIVSITLNENQFTKISDFIIQSETEKAQKIILEHIEKEVVSG